MFPLAAHAPVSSVSVPSGSGTRRGFQIGRWHSRVRGFPEVKGELPVATLADEIETPGEGQVRAFLTVAGNPVLSTPNSGRLDRALAGLDFMVSVDPYLNETTRHADVVLPPLESTQKGHFDFSFLGFAVRNFASYSPPVFPPDPAGMDECDILARLMLIVSGSSESSVSAVHDQLLSGVLEKTGCSSSRDQVRGDGPAERLLDVALRAGAYGDRFGERPGGLSLERLLENPHGIDLGPLEPRIPAVLKTPSGKVELCVPALADESARLLAALDRDRDQLVLIGRRHLRSNNSWMHNVPALVKGRDRCTLQVHPSDADRLALVDGDSAQVMSRAGTVAARVEVTDRVMPGVVSLPHGWGHDLPGVRLSVAAEHPGVNSNVLTDELVMDPLSGNSVLNGIPVDIKPL